MFVVTPEGVIATDPIGLRRPAAKAYIEEIQKITKAPIKYVIYSHSHFDHIAGGQPFKDLGAIFVAHKNAKARIEATGRSAECRRLYASSPFSKLPESPVSPSIFRKERSGMLSLPPQVNFNFREIKVI